MGLRRRVESRNFTDTRLSGLLRELVSSDSKFWKSVAERLSSPRNGRVEVNLGKLDRMAGDGLTLVVPGKVLGAGRVTKKISVAAYEFSDRAAGEIEGAGGKALKLEAFLKSNPEGKKARVVV